MFCRGIRRNLSRGPRYQPKSRHIARCCSSKRGQVAVLNHWHANPGSWPPIATGISAGWWAALVQVLLGSHGTQMQWLPSLWCCLRPLPAIAAGLANLTPSLELWQLLPPSSDWPIQICKSPSGLPQTGTNPQHNSYTRAGIRLQRASSRSWILTQTLYQRCPASSTLLLWKGKSHTSQFLFSSLVLENLSNTSTHQENQSRDGIREGFKVAPSIRTAEGTSRVKNHPLDIPNSAIQREPTPTQLRRLQGWPSWNVGVMFRVISLCHVLYN